MATPTIGYVDHGGPSLVFSQNLFFNSSTKTLSSISVDFGTGGGYVTASWNVPISGTYTTKGVKQIKIKLVFTDNSTYQCYSSIEVTNVSGGQQRYIGTPAAQVFPAEPTHDGGTAYIKYSTTNTTSNPKKLKKPLVVVEGYDVSYIAPQLRSAFNYTDFINLMAAIETQYDLNQKLDEVGGYDLVLEF